MNTVFWEFVIVMTLSNIFASIAVYKNDLTSCAEDLFFNLG